MEEILLTANTTRETGSSSSRRVRRDGVVPGVLYGLNEESVSLLTLIHISEPPSPY